MKSELMINRKKIGEILVNENRISPQRLAEVLGLQKETGRPLGQILIDEGILTQEELTHLLGEQLGIPHLWLRKGLVDPRIVHILPKEKALHFQVIPMFVVNSVVTLATADPNAIFVFDEVAKITGMRVQPVLCRADDIIEAINEYYQQEMSIDDVMNSLDDSDIEVIQGRAEADIAELSERSDESPVVHLTNMILIKAIRDGASDINIEPQSRKFKVRIRIDGLLYELMSHRLELHPPVVSRLKVLANLDISERRIPQDGRIQVQIDGRTVDLRFSSMPGIHGEKVVLRILDRNQAILDIDKLGFNPQVLERFKTVLRSSYGLILVCGPTGSGKTTTLYSAISMLSSSEKNIITIEDPVEYQLEHINQNQVVEGIGLTFAKVLKHALRQDPDIILVGEIRDRETAEIAIQASLTGHLVLSTLHTNDSVSAVTRLLEMGAESYLISASLLAVLAQRLLRTICPECRTTHYAAKAVLQELGLEPDKKIRLARGKGCSACYDSGFKGRTGIHELLVMDEKLRSIILNDPTVDALRGHLRENKFEGLKALGFEKVLQGLTTIEEARRVISTSSR
ncbi:MAG: ATPase, T2SS/T4P/T4SS family [Desulfobacterales bacterium]